MIEEINKLRKVITNPCTKVIADGGINTLDRAIKCLALGFDYVMIGRLFAQSFAACGEVRTHIKTHNDEDIYINYDIINHLNNAKIYGDFKEATLERKYYGMASEQGQIDISGGANKNPEGIETWVKIEYTLDEFRKKFEAALRSTMSYVNANNLDELKSNTMYNQMSISEFKSYYK
jgi:IMP dehydrogenase/GMP reductase